MRIAEAYEARAFGVTGDPALEADGAQGVGRAFGRAHLVSAWSSSERGTLEEAGHAINGLRSLVLVDD